MVQAGVNLADSVLELGCMWIESEFRIIEIRITETAFPVSGAGVQRGALRQGVLKASGYPEGLDFPFVQMG